MKSLKIIMKNKELRDKIMYSLGMIVIFRLLSFIPVPFTDISKISIATEGDAFGIINMVSGGALQNFTIMATGISAYISASIIIQFATYLIPEVSLIAKSPGGDKTIKKVTIILGMTISIIMSLVTTIAMNRAYGILTMDAWYIYALIAACHCAGTGTSIAIGESISNHGFGNGVSLLVYINVLTGIPSIISSVARNLSSGTILLTAIPVALCVTVLMIIISVIAETSERRIPLLYPKASAKGRMQFMHEGKMFFPIKLNLAGVMPIILGSYLMQLLMFIARFDNPVGNVLSKLSMHPMLYTLVFTFLIFIFTYAYVWISFNCREISENLMKGGAVIPTVRPGKETAEYIKNVRASMTDIGALYLSLIYLVPTLLLSFTNVQFIAATSVIILVGVSLDVCKELKVEIDLRKGFSY